MFRKLGCVTKVRSPTKHKEKIEGRKAERFAFLPFLGKQKQPNLLPECLGSDVYSSLAGTNTGNLMSPCCIH